jgi:hypothetical protein
VTAPAVSGIDIGGTKISLSTTASIVPSPTPATRANAPERVAGSLPGLHRHPGGPLTQLVGVLPRYRHDSHPHLE